MDLPNTSNNQNIIDFLSTLDSFEKDSRTVLFANDPEVPSQIQPKEQFDEILNNVNKEVSSQPTTCYNAKDDLVMHRFDCPW